MKLYIGDLLNSVEKVQVQLKSEKTYQALHMKTQVRSVLLTTAHVAQEYETKLIVGLPDSDICSQTMQKGTDWCVSIAQF